MTTVRARLVIDHQIANERTFTCVAKSGGKTVYASTTVQKGPRHLIKQQNLTDLLMSNANLFGGLRPVRVTHFFKSVLALMGSNLILPCKTIGRPRAEVTWLDIDDNVITGQETRFKVIYMFLLFNFYCNLYQIEESLRINPIIPYFPDFTHRRINN